MPVPLAVRVVDVPAHIVLVPLIEVEGAETTVIVLEAVAVQPLASVTVTL